MTTEGRHDWHDVLEHKEMVVTAVCVGETETIEGAGLDGQDLVTAFRKKPFEVRLKVGKLGIEGDNIGDREHHGGIEQAVNVFGGDDYAWWEKELGRELPPGSFGENLVIADLSTEDVLLGDNLKFPDLELEVSGPRTPCGKLSAMMGEKGFGKRFRESRRSGFYCRVFETGSVEVGDTVSFVREPGSNTYISDMLQRKAGG